MMSVIDLSQHTPKVYFEGTHRSRKPEDTLADYGRYLKDFGITRLANVTGLDTIGLPVYVAVRPNSRTLATSQGKGDTPIAAKVSAMMESIETWHGERIHCPVRFESYAELTRHGAVVDIERMPKQMNAAFSVSRPIPWVEGFELNRRGAIWVPYDSVTVNFVKQAHYQNIFAMSSNGLASGNSKVEATLHALYELIERDACTLWQLSSQQQQDAKMFDLNSIVDGYLRQTIDQIQQAGLLVYVWDITSNLGIPTYYAVVLEDPDSVCFRPVPNCSGSGSHLDPRIALSRAINEAIQSRLTVIAGSRDDQYQAEYTRASCQEATRAALTLLRHVQPKMTIDSHTTMAADSFEADIHFLLARLQAFGLDTVVVVDLTQKKYNIPVVKVIVPGLEALASSNIRPGLRMQQLKQGHH